VPSEGREAAVAFREKIITEIFYNLGRSRSGPARRLLGPLFRPPAGRLARIAARADAEAGRTGISGAARLILPDLALRPTVRGADGIPREGPLILASSHPGGFDSVAILACVPRPDIKVFISDVPFTRVFENASRYFIYVPKTPGGRQSSLRSGVDHLQAGGSLLIFPHGEVEPDPELAPGSAEAIGDWSRSLEIMARRVPEARLQAAIASGVLMPKFLRSPLARIRRAPARRQKLAEVVQIIRQMLFPRTVRVDVHLSFGRPVRAGDLAGEDFMPAVARLARGLLDEHMASLAAAR
jgi:1-acyl-sn-glycerol-3-phosphate acyltransferase